MKQVYIIVRNYAFPQGGVTHINPADGFFTSRAAAEAKAAEINAHWADKPVYYVEMLTKTP